MHVAFITDTHFGARADSTPMMQHMAKFYDNVFFPTLEQYDVKRCIHFGDFSDRRKYINYQTASFIHDTYREPMVRMGIHEDVLTGNHDIYFRNSTELSGVLELYRNYRNWVHVHHHPREIDIDGCGILLLPWIADNNRDESMQMISDSKCAIVGGHLEIAGFQMYRGVPALEGMTARAFDRFELVVSGHFHHKSAQSPIHYLGAPYPMIWSDYDDDRGFHLFDTKTHALTFIQNPYSLFVRIVYDDANQTHDYIKDLVQGILAKDSPHHDAYVKVVVRTKTQPYWFDLMIDALYKANAQDVLVVDDIVVNEDDDGTATANNTPDVDTLILMREYVQSLSISCDKDELVKYLQTKYHEAVASTQSARLA